MTLVKYNQFYDRTKGQNKIFGPTVYLSHPFQDRPLTELFNVGQLMKAAESLGVRPRGYVAGSDICALETRDPRLVDNPESYFAAVQRLLQRVAPKLVLVDEFDPMKRNHTVASALTLRLEYSQSDYAWRMDVQGWGDSLVCVLDTLEAYTRLNRGDYEHREHRSHNGYEAMTVRPHAVDYSTLSKPETARRIASLVVPLLRVHKGGKRDFVIQ